MKVLHVLGQLDIGGLECWLKDFVFFSMKRTSISHSVVIEREKIGELEHEFKSLGVSIIRVTPSKKSKIKYLKDIYNVLKKDKYDIVHSHVSFTSGYINFISFLVGVNGRLTHIHSDRSKLLNSSGVFRRLHIYFSLFLIEVFSNSKIAVSKNAAEVLLKIKKVHIIPCGKHFQDFHHVKTDKTKFLSALSWNENDIVLCSIGRLEKVKNHVFIINLLQSLSSEYKYLIIGDGSERKAIESIVQKLGLEERVSLLGSRSDALYVLDKVCDIFLFPSLHEGLGLAAVEAQYYGIPSVISKNVPLEVVIANDVRVVGLDEPNVWLEKILELDKKGRDRGYIEKIKSKFSIQSNVERIIDIYEKYV